MAFSRQDWRLSRAFSTYFPFLELVYKNYRNTSKKFKACLEKTLFLSLLSLQYDRIRIQSFNNNIQPIKVWRKVAFCSQKLAKSGDFWARFGEIVAIFNHLFLQGWRHKWRFWDPKTASLKKYFWKRCFLEHFAWTGNFLKMPYTSKKSYFI